MHIVVETAEERNVDLASARAIANQRLDMIIAIILI